MSIIRSNCRKRPIASSRFLPLLAVAIGTTLAAGPLTAEPPLRFHSEVITLRVLPDTLEVAGDYRFVCNPSFQETMRLFYPYPADSLLGGARMVSLHGREPGDEWRVLEYWDDRPFKGVRWTVPVPHGDTLDVRAVYRQTIRSTYARYIVTSTKKWADPLETARFIIHLPEGAKPTAFSYDFEPATVEGVTAYVYEATDFWPDRDIIVEWADPSD